MTLIARVRRPELMDDAALPADEHIQALRGLARLNWLSRSAAIVWRPIHDFARRRHTIHLTLLDVASGSADIPIALAKRAATGNLQLSLSTCDISPQAASTARHNAVRADVDLRTFVHDVLAADLPATYDIVTCSLFCHHLDPPDVVLLLRRLAAATRRLLIINDLRRTVGGLVLAFAAARLFSRSAVVHTDAVRSARAAYTIREIRELAGAAGLRGVRVRRCWPSRFVLTWERP